MVLFLYINRRNIDIEFYRIPGGKFFGFFDNWNIKPMVRTNTQISAIMLTAETECFCLHSAFGFDYMGRAESDANKMFSMTT